MSTTGFLTIERAGQIALASTILSIISLVFCVFILGTTAWVWSIPEARSQLDRVSFRLMLWSMVFAFGYDICYLLLYPSFDVVPDSGLGCTVMMYWQSVTMGAVNYLCTSIAVNLMLTICFAFNPIQMHLEKWYIIVSMFVAFVQPIVPAALGHFGHDPVYQSCYFTEPDLQKRLLRFGLDLYLWQMLSTLVATIATIAALIFLFRNGRATAKALLQSTSPDEKGIDTCQSIDSSASGYRKCCFMRIFGWRKSKSRTYQLQDKFLSIAFRVSLYPLVMIVMNVVLTVGDMVLSSTDSIDNWQKNGLYVVYYAFYGGRNIFLASIGMFIDPCLRRGIKVARRTRGMRNKQVLENGPDQGEMDFTSALASLSFTPSQVVSPNTTQQVVSEKPGGSSFTTSFPGVQSFSLPSGMTDEVDVDLRGSALLPPPLAVILPTRQISVYLSTGDRNEKAMEEISTQNLAPSRSREPRDQSNGRRRGSRMSREAMEEQERKYEELTHLL